MFVNKSDIFMSLTSDKKKFLLLSEEVQPLNYPIFSPVTTILFIPVISRSPENRLSETSTISYYSVYLPFCSQFQNGDQQIYQDLYSSRYVDHRTGPFGCIFSYRNISGFLEISPFILNDKICQFLTLPFGMAVAPQVFTRVFQAVVAHFHAMFLQAHSYLDDSHLNESNPESLSRQTRIFNKLLLDLGFLMWSKTSEILPSRSFRYLGEHYTIEI